MKKFEITICDDCPCNQTDEYGNHCPITVGTTLQAIEFKKLADDECHYLPDGFTCSLAEIRFKNGKTFKPKVLKYSTEPIGGE